MKKILIFLVNTFFYILKKFSIFSAIASASYYGTIIGMILNGLFWPYKIVYWLTKHFTLNTGFRESFGEVGSAIISGLMGLPTNFTTKPIITIIITGTFLLIHFWNWPISKLQKSIINKISN